MDKMNGQSHNIVSENIARIKELFPNVITEGKIDFDALRVVLGDEVDTSKEKYQFTWNGKSESIKLAQTPSSGTLRPCKEKSRDWDSTENIYIEGDNLEVLKLLQKTYYNRIKMIYIDPPYNTGSDFVYKDSFGNSIENYIQQTNQEQKSNPDTSGRFHSSWLDLIYPRLILARNLLTDDGAIFISIDDHEVENLTKMCSEVFGENNRVATFPWRKRTAKSDVPFGVSQDYEWIVCYAKSNMFKASVEGKERKYYETDDFPGRPWRIHDLTKQTTASERPNSFFTIVNPKNGKEYPANPNRTWAITEETFKEYYGANRIVFPGDYDFLNISKPSFRYWKEDDMAKAGDDFGRAAVSTKLPDNIGMSQDGTKEIAALFGRKVFSFPKPTTLIRYLIDTNVDSGDIVLDFFSGSASTASAVMVSNAESGRRCKYLMVQLPELCPEGSEALEAGYKTICEIGEERIRLSGEKIKNDYPLCTQDLDIGFKVYKLDSTNINPWDNTNEYDENTIYNSATVFKLDRTKEDILYEIMLKYGVFDQPVSEVTVNEKKLYCVGQRHMIVCLEDNIDSSDIVEICELCPRVVVFKEDGFKDDNSKINAEYNLKNAGVEDIKCI